MSGDIYLYCFIICMAFLSCNVLHIGLKNKTYCLPSTIFAFIWGLTSLGIYLISQPNSIITSSHLVYNRTIEEIGGYQFEILAVCFLAFFLAHYNLRKEQFDNSEYLIENGEIELFVKKFRWILFILCAIGLLRLFLVVSIVGFDYSAIRTYYLVSRINYNEVDLNLIRIGSYAVQLGMLYVAIYGAYCAIYGISIKGVIVNFLLFSPFQLSFGGRLYILSFFVPFFISYFAIKTLDGVSLFRDKRNLWNLFFIILIPLMLTSAMQSLKLNRQSDSANIEENVSDLFYTTSIYIRLNKQWQRIPFELDRDLGYGRNSIPWLGNPSPDYQNLLDEWKRYKNPAIVCVPSMIPDMYLDFGRYGSLVIYFILFYYLEYIAMLKLSRYSFVNFSVYLLLCLFAFNTATSAMSTNFKTLIVGLAFVYLFNMLYKKYISNAD